MANRIRDKLQSARLIEHIDGDTCNNAVANLRWATFEDWLRDPSKTIDWILYVTASEQQFVLANMENFRIVFGVSTPVDASFNN